MSDEDLEERVARLETGLRDLQAEIRPRGPLGLPRPPTPAELFRAADEHAIPAMIASLTAAIHALELLRRVLRASGARPPEDAGGVEGADPAGRVGLAALARLDGALSELSETLSGEPPDSDARDLLAEIRALREELADRVENAESASTGDPAATPTDERDAALSAVDVEAELDSIREDLDDQAGDGT
jgi:hypothetical protein